MAGYKSRGSKKSGGLTGNLVKIGGGGRPPPSAGRDTASTLEDRDLRLFRGDPGAA